MKIARFFLIIILFASLQVFSQNQEKEITGIIKQVHPKFLGAQSLMVDKTELVLMADQSDTTNSTFLINKEYADLLVKNNGNLTLNPKYKDKTLVFFYKVNGKGWNCISQIKQPAKPTLKKTENINIKAKGNG